MADSNRSTNTNFNDIKDDDPFAELTRIMGHDPKTDKEPVENVGEDAGVGDAWAHDEDLDIDLESELMGELSSFDEEQRDAPEHEEATHEAVPETAAEGRTSSEDATNENLEDALSDLDLEMDFDAAFAEEEFAAERSRPADPFGTDGPERADDPDELAAEPVTSDDEGPVFLRLGAGRPDAEAETGDRNAQHDDAVAVDAEASDLERELVDESGYTDPADHSSLHASDPRADDEPADVDMDDAAADVYAADTPAAGLADAILREGELASEKEGRVASSGGTSDETESRHSDMTEDAPADQPQADLETSDAAHWPGFEAEEPFASEDAATGSDESADEAQEHFPPLYAGRQPEMETDDQTETADASPPDEAVEAFDYSRAAADRHDFLAETLEEEAPATQSDSSEDDGGVRMEEVRSGPESQDNDAAASQGDETGGATADKAQASLRHEAAPRDEADDPAAESFDEAASDLTNHEVSVTQAGEDAALGEDPPHSVSTHEAESDARADAQAEDRAPEETSDIFAESGVRPMHTPAAAAASPEVDRWTEWSADGADAEPAGPHEELEPRFVAGAAAVTAASAVSSGSAAAPPEIETVDIPEKPAAVEDDLDIPDVKTEEEAPPAIEFDDFEAELAGAFGSLSGTAAPEEEDDLFAQEAAEQEAPATDERQVGAETGMAPASGVFASVLHEPPRYNDDAAHDVNAGETGINGEYAGAVGPESSDLHYYDPTATEDMAHAEENAGGGTRRRGILVASLVALVAVIGGVGAFALSSGNDGPASPAVVRAGDEPVKVKPENPGGAKVPNQDSEVYQRVAGKDAGEPAQEKLVSTTEEPMDVTGPEPRVVTPQAVNAEGAETSASTKSEQRLAPSGGEDSSRISDELSTVKARRVKTVVVKPDGTIVSTADQPAQAAASSASASGNVAGGSGNASFDSASEAIAASGLLPSTEDGAATPTTDSMDDTTAAAGDQTESSGDPAPLPTARPPEQSQPQAATPQVASTDTESQTAPSANDTAPAAGAPTSEWSVQISSQPSVKAAQQSYQNMAQRYGNILSGQGVNIVRADIDGKGTYYRVRIPSSSKDDAIALCSELKSAGGSCFVSK